MLLEWKMVCDWIAVLIGDWSNASINDLPACTTVTNIRSVQTDRCRSTSRLECIASGSCNEHHFDGHWVFPLTDNISQSLLPSFPRPIDIANIGLVFLLTDNTESVDDSTARKNPVWTLEHSFRCGKHFTSNTFSLQITKLNQTQNDIHALPNDQLGLNQRKFEQVLPVEQFVQFKIQNMEHQEESLFGDIVQTRVNFQRCLQNTIEFIWWIECLANHSPRLSPNPVHHYQQSIDFQLFYCDKKIQNSFYLRSTIRRVHIGNNQFGQQPCSVSEFGLSEQLRRQWAQLWKQLHFLVRFAWPEWTSQGFGTLSACWRKEWCGH